MITQHTPGPWHLSAAKDCIWHQDHGRICAPPNHAQVWNWEPNARLIAAAPELLRELEACTSWMEELRESGDAGFWDWSKDCPYTTARAAIAKAKGDQE